MPPLLLLLLLLLGLQAVRTAAAAAPAAPAVEGDRCSAGDRGARWRQLRAVC